LRPDGVASKVDRSGNAQIVEEEEEEEEDGEEVRWE
jgi:hypothetical protein